MTTLQRNFRSAYLEKVGIKGVEEKKSLDIILNDQHVDIEKLEQFCLRFPLPATYRIYVWKLLLGILPTHVEVREYVQRQRQQQYDDVKETLVVMRQVNQSSSVPHVHLRMFLIEEGILPLKENNILENLSNQAFIALSMGIGQLEDNVVDCFWITKKLCTLLHDHIEEVLPAMCDQMVSYLRKEDNQLFSHLHNTCSVTALPSRHWFMSCFAVILPDCAFEKVCDRVIGGAFQLLVFIGVAVLIIMRRQLLGKNNTEDIIKYISKLPDESGDMVMTKALELWQKHGCPLAPATTYRGDSPPPTTDRPHT